MRLELTKRADYAIRTVLALARAADDERLSVRRVAADQRVPERFLPQVMRDLVRAGLIDGTVGRAGGYRIAKPSAEISLLDVVEAVEGDSRRGPGRRPSTSARHDRGGGHSSGVTEQSAHKRIAPRAPKQTSGAFLGSLGRNVGSPRHH
jgi:Rrf2 family protein